MHTYTYFLVTAHRLVLFCGLPLAVKHIVLERTHLLFVCGKHRMKLHDEIYKENYKLTASRPDNTSVRSPHEICQWVHFV